MSNNLITSDILTRFSPNKKNGKIHKNIYNNTQNTAPKHITNMLGYYWHFGYNKRYGRYVHLTRAYESPEQVETIDINESELNTKEQRKHLKVNRDLRMEDFLYDNVSKKDLQLIRKTFKNKKFNLKCYMHTHSVYSYATHRKKYIIISWVINNKYVIHDVRDFINLIKWRLI